MMIRESANHAHQDFIETQIIFVNLLIQIVKLMINQMVTAYLAMPVLDC
jgi:hypothetical protein